jgi:hypothetical protein
MRTLLADMIAQWHDLDRRISAFDAEFVSWARENEDAPTINIHSRCHNMAWIP